MKYLFKYNKISESHNHAYMVDDIVEIFVDIIEDRNVTFKSIIGDMKYKDYLEKNSKYENFRPQVNTGRFLRSQFQIVFHSIKNYDDYINILDDMKAAIGRLSDIGWNMYNMKLGTSAPPKNNGVVNITFASFYFSKPDIKVNPDWVLNKDFLKKIFRDHGLLITDIDESENEDDTIDVRVEFDSMSMNGRLYNDMESIFDSICDKIGFESYHYTIGDFVVTFTY
jgi:hypothetical protein